MSWSKDRSFNANILKRHVGKVNMSTAQQFSYTVLEAGPGALMSKQDMKSLPSCRTGGFRVCAS